MVCPRAVCLALHTFHYTSMIYLVCKLFADDVKLYCFPTSSETQLQSALDKVAHWSHIWQLQLAPEKCQVFSLAGCRKRTNHEYSINGQTLQQVDRVMDLEIMMDPSLKFAPTLVQSLIKLQQFHGRSGHLSPQGTRMS